MNRTPTGRFLKGHGIRSPGRPPLRTLRAVVAERLKSGDAGSLDDALFQVFEALLGNARKGDPVSARLLLDHLVDRVEHHDLGVSLESLVLASLRPEEGAVPCTA